MTRPGVRAITPTIEVREGMIVCRPRSGGIAQAWPATLILALGILAWPSARAAPQRPAQKLEGGGEVSAARPAPMPGMFAFEGALSDFSGKVVKDSPFSAVVVSETFQRLADGNRIDRKSEGSLARDTQGRTRREMTLENIGPWTASGEPPRLVFINDPVAGDAFFLNQNQKVAYRLPLLGTSSRLAAALMRRAAARRVQPLGRDASPRAHPLRNEIVTESLGRKRLNGLRVIGTRTIRIIPAGRIGNEKPIVITTDRWYSFALRTTILVRRSDPRFGTSTFELTHIKLAPPSPSLFAVPVGYKVEGAGAVHLRPKTIAAPRFGRKLH